MLPNSNSPTPVSRTVFINPNFKTTAHINPNFFVKKSTSTIHVNPQFLQKIQETERHHTNNQNCHQNLNSESEIEAKPLAKIIAKSKTKIVRVHPTTKPKENYDSTVMGVGKSPMIKIGLRKLVRLSTPKKPQLPAKNSITSGSSRTEPKIYKIDRRVRKKSINGIKKKSFVSQYALSRGSSEFLNSKKLLYKRKITPSQYHLLSKSRYSPTSVNKKLELLSINGVLYKSTRNKLQRSDTCKPKGTTNDKKSAGNSKKSTGERVLFVRGNKFILDKSGLKLTNVDDVNKRRFGRIDIGGLTYVAKSNDVFVRTDIHKTRNHLSVAKQKSINLLSNKLFKSNVPCPIYQKLGKCAAFERGKCPKLHEKSQISICSKFLRGDCLDVNCLLSHSVSLSKMPVCKFYLQGCCAREDCPYLHKKLSQKAEICLEFLKGFCRLADKCNKRHEFVCPDFDRKGKCDKVKCVYCRKKDKPKLFTNIGNRDNKSLCLTKQHKLNKDDNPVSEEKSTTSRYFIEESDKMNLTKAAVVNVEQTVSPIVGDIEIGEVCRRRPELGDLPAFIPL